MRPLTAADAFSAEAAQRGQGRATARRRRLGPPPAIGAPTFFALFARNPLISHESAEGIETLASKLKASEQARPSGEGVDQAVTIARRLANGAASP